MSGTDERPVASDGSVVAPVTEASPTVERGLCDLINRHGLERFSDTPDWALARMLVRMLDAYASAANLVRPCDRKAIPLERIW